MIRITTVIGARPQFIKASVMSRHFKESGMVDEVLVHTGQHFDHNMSDIFFAELNIPPPAYNLGINNASHGKMTGNMLIAIEEVLLRESPHYVLVYGDTNSTLAAALAAKKLHIPIIHIEAGLRSRNHRMPEEINRIVTDRISDLLCCPSETAVQNLRSEGFDLFDCTFRQTGDIMEDALKFYEKDIRSPILKVLGVQPGNYILSTAHRAENTNDPERMDQIKQAWLKIAEETHVVVPLHPRTRDKIKDLPDHKNLHFIEPVGYLDNLQLIRHCTMVMTDSGGMQKEAYWMKKFCITLRDETEWNELADVSCNFITGAHLKTILEKYTQIKRLSWEIPDGIFGGGNSREKIYHMVVQDAARRGFL
jgi:UDP-GlcNAc3NAcA epimerase